MEEEHVGFLLSFEDNATAGLQAASSAFDVASAALQKGVDAAVEGLTAYETATERVATALYKADDLWRMSTTRAAALAASVKQATEAVSEFRDESAFVLQLPKDGWMIQAEEREFEKAGQSFYRAFDDEMEKRRGRFFAEKDFTEGGKSFFKGFDQDLSRSSFQRDLAAVIHDSTVSGSAEALANQKRDRFLVGPSESARRPTGLLGAEAFGKALAPFKGFIDQLRNLAIFAALFASFGQIFLPFMEIFADFFDTLFAPLEEFLLEVADALTPVVDELSVAIYEHLQPAFTALLGLLENDIVPVLKDVVKALIPVFKWLVDLGVQIVQWVADVFQGKKGVEAMNTALVLLITAALTPLGLAIYAVTAAFIGFTAALLTNPITWIVGGIALVVYALKEWAGGWDKLWEATVNVFSAIKSFLGGIFKWMFNAFSALWSGITAVWEGGLQGLFQFWYDYLSPMAWIGALLNLGATLGKTLLGLVGGLVSQMLGLGGSLVQALWDGITGGFATWVFPGPFGTLAKWTNSWFSSDTAAADSPIAKAAKSGAQVGQAFAEGTTKAVAEEQKKMPEWLSGTMLGKIVEAVKSDEQKTVDHVKDFSENVQAAVKSEPPVSVRVMPEIATEEGDVPTTELTITTPEEASEPVVRELVAIQRMLSEMFERLTVREGEGRTRRELSQLAGFEA